MTHVYDKNLNHIISLNYQLETFMTDPSLYYPDWEKEYYASSVKFENPILDNEQVREMTREEQILMLNKLDLLQDGEIIQDGVIKKIEIPKNLMRPLWNKELKKWQEGMSKEELMLKRKDKILEYKKVKEEISALEEFSMEFESDDTVEMLKLQMQQLKEEINELLQIIKRM